VKRLVLAAVAALLFVPAVAEADVLVHAPRSPLTCGGAITVGVFAQPGTPRSERTTYISATDKATGIVWWRKTVVATTRWRYWSLPSGYRGRCGTTIIKYLPGRFGRFVVRFRPEST
jgi:hypothetical protein